MKKYLKIFCCLLSVLLFMTFFSGCFYLNKDVNLTEYMELSLLPIKNIPKDFSANVYSALEENYIETDELCAFTGIEFDTSSNYIMLEIYYISHLLENLHAYNNLYTDIKTTRIVKNATCNIQSNSLPAIDTIATFCLDKMINDSVDYVALNTFLEGKTDNDNSLLYENSVSDDMESKVSFTVEVLNMLNISGISIDDMTYKKGIQNYYDAARFLSPSDGDTLFNSGGLALYAMNSVNNSLDIKKHVEWYKEWKKEYNDFEIQNAEDLLYFVCVYYQIDKLFCGSEIAIERVRQYINDINLIDYVEEVGSAQLIYSCLSDFIIQLSAENQNILTSYCQNRLDFYIEKLTSYSFQNGFYGLLLANSVGFCYNMDKLERTYTNLYLELLESCKEGEDINTEQIINDTYYYSMILSQVYTIAGDADIFTKNDAIEQTIDLISGSVCQGSINNPKAIRKLCEIISNNGLKPTSALFKYLKKYVEELSCNEYILDSYYFGDLFVIDKIMGYGLILSSDVVQVLPKLKYNTMYKEEIEESPSLYATFEVFCLCSRFEGLEISTSEVVETSTHINKMVTESSGFYDLNEMFYIVSLISLADLYGEE